MNNDYYENREAPEEPVRRDSRLGLTSMISGILGLAGVTVEFSVGALILSLSARRRDGGFNIKSRLGFIFGLVGIGAAVLAGIFLVFFVKELNAAGGIPDSVNLYNGFIFR
ncbi:MAG: hypothetical protein MJ137_04585 [Clostridia bacterium]|nr:hypothetical protein [Clostridia bacterium]